MRGGGEVEGWGEGVGEGEGERWGWGLGVGLGSPMEGASLSPHALLIPLIEGGARGASAHLLCYVMLCYVMLCYVMLCYAHRGWRSRASARLHAW